VSAEPLTVEGREAPPPPRPAGVIDLGRYRGRTGAGPVVAPPPTDTAVARSSLTAAVVAPIRAEPAERTDPMASTTIAGADGEVVIRRLRLGSVLRMAFGFSLCAVIVVVGAGVLIWITISTLGVVENLESLAEDLGWVDVTFDGPAMLRAALIGGGILVVAASLLSVVFAEVFNLLSTITGGLKAEVGPAPLTRRERRRIHKALKRRAREQASAA
jgi:hypothetical protein